MTAAHRVAVYFAPPDDHPLWAAGSAWLGRDARAGQPVTPPRCAEVQAPWRYGLHATLKPPLRLAHGVSEAQWLAAVQALAARHRRFELPPLQVATLTDFLALRPCEPLPDGGALQALHALQALADACVVELECHRAPLSPQEQQRYLAPHLSARQQQQVQRYGYAHVLEDWRFHITLTGSLAARPAAEADRLATEARRHFRDALAAPLPCDALCVFAEPAPGAPFVLTHRFPLACA